MSFEPEKIATLNFTPNLNPNGIILLKINSDQTFANYSLTSSDKSTDISETITEENDFFTLSYTIYKETTSDSATDLITKVAENTFK